MEMAFFNQPRFYTLMGVWMLFLYRLLLPLCIPGFARSWNKKEHSTHLNNSKPKREATNDVKIVVNPVRQAFNTTCGVYQRRSFFFLKHKQGLDYLMWGDKRLKALPFPSKSVLG